MEATTATKPKKVQEEWDVISPDGFSIAREDTWPTEAKAKKALKEWMKRYEHQGYYSSMNGRIELAELERACKIKQLKTK